MRGERQHKHPARGADPRPSPPPSLQSASLARRARPARATTAEPTTTSSAPPAASPASDQAPTFEVYLDKPLGVRWARGKDGAAYVSRTDPSLGNTDPAISPGDKLVRVSASFGDDIWEALNFGQVMYAIKTRNAGKVYLKFERKFGDMSAMEAETLSEAERRFKAERGGGNYGAGTKEMQANNYLKAKELAAERVVLFEGALKKFNGGDHAGALVDFENVLAMEPANYLGDDFARVTQVYRATQYNIACCYAAIGQVDAGLEALDDAMRAGFSAYTKIRADPNLAPLRADKKAFAAVIDKYDEPILNTEAIAFLKRFNPFSKGGDDDE